MRTLKREDLVFLIALGVMMFMLIAPFVYSWECRGGCL